MQHKDRNIPSFLTGSAPQPFAAAPVTAPPPVSGVEVMTLAQMTLGEPWQLEQPHTRDHHLFLWITRGQGRILLHGLRRGFGAHNAIFIPAGRILALEGGRQIMGQAMCIPADGRVALPERTRHLRIKEALTQAELTGIFDAMRRELHEDRALLAEALIAQASLMSVWLRRQLLTHPATAPASAAERIVRRYCDLLVRHFRSGRSMADYADELGITSTHLTRVCKQCAGMTAADLLNQMIQHEVRNRLTREREPIKQVADSMGFGSAAYFTRFCQHHFGATPSQIRKRGFPQRPGI